MRATSYMRSLGMSTLQYIDDRMAAERKLGRGICDANQEGDFLNGETVTYCLVEILTRLGYTLSLRKCSLFPLKCIRFLGFLADSVKQANI